MKLKIVEPTPEILAYRDKLMVTAKDCGNLSAEDILAVFSYTVGQLVALQDRTKYTGDEVLSFVVANIEGGNAQAIEKMVGKPGKTVQ